MGLEVKLCPSRLDDTWLRFWKMVFAEDAEIHSETKDAISAGSGAVFWIIELSEARRRFC